VEEHMDAIVVDRLLQIGPVFECSLDLLNSVSDNVTVVTGQKKNLFTAEIINKDTGNRVRV
jgi:hypothetical protein